MIEFLSLFINKSSDIFRSKAPSKMSSLLDKIPFVPKLTKFLVCLDLYQGVRYTSMVLMVLWVIYAIVAFFKLALSGAIWSLIWYVISLSLFSLSLRYFCLQVLGQRRRLRSRGLGHAEEQQALPAARSLHLHLQCHRRDHQRDHQLCDISYFLVSGSFLFVDSNFKYYQGYLDTGNAIGSGVLLLCTEVCP